MTHFFLDSSALIKRYVAEAGTDWLRTITAPDAGNTLIMARITSVEVISGVSRRKREGLMSPRTAQAIKWVLNRHAKREYMVVELSAAVVERAQDLLENHPLRAYDAIQLASAMLSNTRLVAGELAPLIFVSADARLLEAATSEGLNTDHPLAHP
jgi:hypothetical protein